MNFIRPVLLHKPVCYVTSKILTTHTVNFHTNSATLGSCRIYRRDARRHEVSLRSGFVGCGYRFQSASALLNFAARQTRI